MIIDISNDVVSNCVIAISNDDICILFIAISNDALYKSAASYAYIN